MIIVLAKHLPRFDAGDLRDGNDGEIELKSRLLGVPGALPGYTRRKQRADIKGTSVR